MEQDSLRARVTNNNVTVNDEGAKLAKGSWLNDSYLSNLKSYEKIISSKT